MKLRTKFQDEDFELGEVVNADVATMPDGRIKLQGVAKNGGLHTIFYDSLEKICSEWEDVSEEEVWYLGEEIGNYALPKEEARKITEKILAWKRLKDVGFRFDGIEIFSEGLLEIDGVLPALEGADNAERLKIIDDLDLLFSMKDE